MKIFLHAFLLLFISTSLYAEVDAPDDRREAYDCCLKKLNSIFTQKATREGGNGKRVTCIMIPTKETVVVAWEIENPNNETLDIKSSNIRFYSDQQFDRIEPSQAVSAIFDWDQTELAFKDSRQEWKSLNTPEGEVETENYIYSSAFQFGQTSDDLVYGITYFGCKLKSTPKVTAEIDLGDELFKFPFDDVGP